MEDVERFLEPQVPFVERSDFFVQKMTGNWYYERMNKKTRVLGLFHDKKDYTNEFQIFKQAA